MLTFSLPRAVSLPILSSIRVIPRLPAGDRRIRCVRNSPWLTPNDVGMLHFCEARQTWFRWMKFTDATLTPPNSSILGWRSCFGLWKTGQYIGNALAMQPEESWTGAIV